MKITSEEHPKRLITLEDHRAPAVMQCAQIAAQSLAEMWDLACDLGQEHSTCFDGLDEVVTELAGQMNSPLDGKILRTEDNCEFAFASQRARDTVAGGRQ